jgi:nickel-dependent lactate racemase
VIASCGGFPLDLNLIQAHKALEAASNACEEGGTILLLAECRDGLGRSDLMKWFAARNSLDMGKMLCEKYQVNGQTAWSLLRKAERFDVRLVTSLPEDEVSAMQIRKVDLPSIGELLEHENGGYIIPAASTLQIKPEDA